jgi:hypothetical protein
MGNRITFDQDADGYFFSYDRSNISQYVARLTGISTMKLHNIVRKHNGRVFKERRKRSVVNFYRFKTMEECRKAAEELDNLILMKKLVG